MLSQALMVSRRFAEIPDIIAEMKREAVTDSETLEVAALESHYAALSGRIRESIKKVRPLLSRDDVFGSYRARGSWIVGLACYRSGHYTWAARYHQIAAAYYRLAGRSKDLAGILINLGLIAKNQGKIALALEHLDEAAYLLRGKHTKTNLRLLVNRGICLLRLGQAEKAKSCFLEARNLASESNDTVFTIAIHNNLGHIYRLEGDFDTAEKFYSKALSMARESKDSDRQACISLEFLGEMCTEEGRLSEALLHLSRAHDLAKKLAPQGDLMMEVLRRRGETHAAAGRHAEALEDLRRAIQLCGARGEKREQVLAERAYAFVSSTDARDLGERIQIILDEIDDLGDRFEYARTVYRVLLDGRLATEMHPWPVAAARHYFNSLGSRIWKERFESVTERTHTVLARPQSPDNGAPPRLHTNSSRFARTLDAARLASASRHPVLLLGETGVGKEVIAQFIHEHSDRASGPLVAINCGALPGHLAESELFGHVRGAFTGAEKDKLGLFEAAEGGTVLLDEVADLPQALQVKLLRVLDAAEVRRVGETASRTVNVRILAATNKDDEALVRDGTFRRDLYHRLKVFRIEVPALRHRREDVLVLARRFLEEEAQSTLPIRLSSELERWLAAYEWPGNVRELLNLCRYLSVRAWGRPMIDVADLPDELCDTAVLDESSTLSSPFAREKRDLERTQILRALHETRGNILATAQLLGMGRNTITRRMREYGVTRADFRTPAVD